MDYPKISIVTPNFNKGNYLEETILSVLNQEYPNLEYIVIDGGSSDNSTAIIEKYAAQLKYTVSEKDNGMYHALQKGFSHSTGEIMGWLNSDDILHPKSLFTLAELFTSFNSVEWIQGHPTVIDKIGRVVYNRPGRNNSQDFYSKRYHDGIFIQQESTYWKRSLWEKAGGFVSTEYKYAGDFELWIRFFDHALLYNTSSMIGAFRVLDEGQLSSNNYPAYLAECDAIINKINPRLKGKGLTEEKEKGIVNKLVDKLTVKKPAQVTTTARIEYDFSKHEFYLALQ